MPLGRAAGAKPIPDSDYLDILTYMFQVNGYDGVWILLTATEPARTGTETTLTPAELRTSSQKSLGALTFRLADLEAVPDFAPAAHKGHNMHAKGYLVRQPNAERISLSSMEMLDSTCGP